MAKKRHTAEQVIAKLPEAEVELAKGQPISKVVRKLGVTEQTYYRSAMLSSRSSTTSSPV